MILKHKKMRDVAAQVIQVISRGAYKICWGNLLGTIECPEPFHMGSGNRLAIETITITDWKDWEVFTDAINARPAKARH